MNPFYILLRRFLIKPLTGLFCVSLIFGVGYYFINHVSLVPKIDANFFFAKDSPIYLQNQQIMNKFIVDDGIVLNMPSSDLSNKNYQNIVRAVSDRTKAIPGVKSVQSITHGPEDLNAATENPLWTRLLDTKSGKGSLIVAFVDRAYIPSIVAELIEVKSQYASRINISISGIPYIVEQMRRMLSRDMETFMSYVLIICSSLIFIIFLSFFVMIGSIVTALFAAASTLIIQKYLGIEIGILTANLGAIIYVLTVSHIVFLASNWRNQESKNPSERLAQTITVTLPASFWAMLTTLFGFLSLVFVGAQPLIELGYGGVTGSLIAFVSAYLIFPLFLRFSRIPKTRSKTRSLSFFPFPWPISLPLGLSVIFAAGFVFYEGYPKLDTDPSLLQYFKPGSDIHSGIAAVDRSGGSNPLNFVISQRNKKPLKNEEAYSKLMALQYDLESHPSVGSVMSLPILMAETQQNWLVSLLPWGSILNRLSAEQFGSIARGFISADFDQALFIVRMIEQNRNQERDRIINQLMAKPRKHGLQLDLVGGTYYLQSELAKKIRASMKQGILSLLALFTLICLLISLSLTSSFFSVVSIAGIVAGVIGSIGYFGIPIDIISSPSINICLGLAVDGIIHLLMDAKRSSNGPLNKEGVRTAVAHQLKPILVSTMVIAGGFSVFYLSEFPPSQRFGLEIVFGSVVATTILVIFLIHALMLVSRKRNEN